MLCGISFCFNVIRDVMLVVMSDKRCSEDQELLVAFQSRLKPLAASIMPAAVQRSAIALLRQ
jgi:hypothetical protein